MVNKPKNIPLFPFLFAIFPVLALLGHNIQEVDPAVALRPAVIAVGGTLVVLLAARLVLQSWVKASLVASLFVLLFFTYGHLYHLLKEIPGIGIRVARHRYLLPVIAFVFLAGFGLIAWKVKNGKGAVPALNLIAALLLVYPTFQVVSSLLKITIASEKQSVAFAAAGDSFLERPKVMPDIYYIILDMHTRSDALQQDYGYDNTRFIDQLRELGFYVADCSRSNYTSTDQSLVSSLNLDYMDEIFRQLETQGLSHDDYLMRLKQNVVRYQLESIGYKTFAFESDYEWSRFTDADAYLGYSRQPFALQALQPFEVMLIQNSALLLWSDTTYQDLPEYISTPFHDANFSLEDHINRQLFTIDQLPKLATLPAHKFIFAHIIVPHFPFVFEADGSIVTDPGYYSGELQSPVDGEHFVRGYLNQVEFIDSQIVEVARGILENSDVPPIIIIQGDHGLEKENRLTILNAYYLPDSGSGDLYPSITPVNSFRIIFNTYFSANLELLSDRSYNDQGQLTNESYSTCTRP